MQGLASKNLQDLNSLQLKVTVATSWLKSSYISNILFQKHVEANFVEKEAVSKLRAELEARARTELNAKLEEVNKYLEEQAQARERLDKMRDSNELDMRSEFEKKNKNLSVCHS